MTDKSVKKLITDYFDLTADLIAKHAQIASVGTHPTDLGTNREVICQYLLKEHLPKRLVVGEGGQLFGLDGIRSKQVDIIIASDVNIALGLNTKPQIPVESVLCLLEVKSELSSGKLKDALDNMASVPHYSDKVIKAATFGVELSKFFDYFPIKIIFAFESELSAETCAKKVRDFYEANPPKREQDRIHAVICNNKFHIRRSIAGKVDDPWDWSTFSANEEGRGMMLFWMMYELAKGVEWLNHTRLDFSPYYALAYGISDDNQG